MKPDDKIRLQYMLDAAQEAITFLQTLKGERLGNNRLVSQAIVRLIEVVGEAAVQISKEYKAANRDYYGHKLSECVTELSTLILI